MSSLHNHQRVVVQMEKPVLDREGGFPVKELYRKKIRKNQLNKCLSGNSGMRFVEVIQPGI